MMDSIVIFIDSLIISWSLFYAGSRLLNEKIDYKSKLFFVNYVLFSTYIWIGYIATDSFIRIILNFIVLSFVYSKLFKIQIGKGIIASFISNFYIFISEIIFTLLVVTIFKFDMQSFQEFYFGTVITNICIAIIIVLITYIKRITLFCQKLIFNFNINSYKIVLFFTLMTLTTLSLLLYYIYFDINLIGSLILGIILICIFTAITIGLVKEKVDNNKLKAEYEILLDNLEEYEKMYSLQRRKNHEYKNDLLIIRNMIEKTNKEALTYIDSIIGLKQDEKQNWMEILKRIPEGGLRGILYYKLLQLQERDINVEFSISKAYSMKNYNLLIEEVKIKICKLLGIYLDNAIQAVEKLNEKNIYISIEENKKYIIFKIANNFNNNIDLDRIYEEGYTTNENGRGFGLSIAKEIIESEDLIINETKIVKDKFIQEIKIVKPKNTTLK